MCAAISKITVPVEITVRLSDPETVVKALAVKAVTEQRYLLTVAYAPNLPDIGVARDGHIDFASKEVVEEACFSFARKGLKVGLWHKAGTADQHPAEVVETYGAAILAFHRAGRPVDPACATSPSGRPQP